MPANKSAYLRTKVVKHNLGVTAFTMPTNTYLALMTSNPTVNNTGVEVTGGSYARKLIDWGTESGGVLPTDAATVFADLPSTTITHWAIYDALTLGNLLYFGQMEIPLSITSGQDLTFASGNIQISEA